MSVINKNINLLEKRRFVIGDVHGCFNTLTNLLFIILNINQTDEIYFLGDYIDRGPRSKEVLDLLISLQEKDYQLFPIIGNHETMMLDYYLSPGNEILWLRNGGKYTWKSFKVEHPGGIPKEYFDFLKSLPLYYELEDFIIVHAGLNFERENIFEDEFAMIWGDDFQYDIQKAKGKKLIIGHRVQRLEKIRTSLSENVIMLDGGCVFINYSDYGNLCALELNSMELFYTKNID